MTQKKVDLPEWNTEITGDPPNGGSETRLDPDA